MKFNLKAFAKRAYEEAMEEDIATNAAQVAFYFIFALFPPLRSYSASSDYFSANQKPINERQTNVVRLSPPKLGNQGL